MKILVSACLLGVNCKYDGGNNYSAKLEKFLTGLEVVPVCPEVLGGLPTPRPPAELVEGRVLDAEGRDVTQAFIIGARRAVEQAVESGAEFAVLQSRSPSCGVRQVYDGSFSGRLREGQGLFAAALLAQGIKVIDVENF